jgi:hypothetical protein
MNRLDIDFSGRRRRSPWAGRVLMALAAAVCVDSAISYRDARELVHASELRLAQARPRSAPAAKVPAEELAAVRETLDRLAMPWDRLFGALESAATDQVALLGIEPDSKAGTVVISGDSKDYLAVLSYVVNLGQSEALNRVQLVRHEVKANDPRRPVSFAISAGWSEARR